MSDKIKDNCVKYGIVSVLHAVALLISSGTVVQTFMIWFGVANGKVEVYSSITLIVQVAAMAACAFTSDKFKNLKKIVTVCFFVLPSIFLALISVSTGLFTGENSIYGVILAVSIICNLALGIHNVFSYKLPYSIFDINDYGRIGSIVGILSGVISIGVSLLLSYCVGKFDYRIVMTIAFSIGSLLWIACGVLTSTYKTISVEESRESVGLKEFFTYSLFYKAIAPTVLRGVGMGIFGLIAAIGLRDGVLNTETATYLTVFTSLSAIAGNLAYLFLDRKVKHKHLIIISGVLSGVFLSLISAWQSIVTFYVFYFLGNVAITVISMAHPVLVFESVPYKNIGRYTAWRMLFMTFGQALPGFFIESLYVVIGAFGIMIIGAVCSLISSIWLGMVLKKQQ